MTKSTIRDRAEYAREYGSKIGNEGVVECAEEVIAKCDSRKYTAEDIVKTHAYAVVARVYYR